MKKKELKKLDLKKSVIKKLEDLSKIKGGRDPRTISGIWNCTSDCPNQCTAAATCCC